MTEDTESPRPAEDGPETLEAEALETLGWDRLVRALARSARSAPGADRCLALRPADGRATAEILLDETAEARRLRAEESIDWLEGAADLAGIVRRAAKGAILEGTELLVVARVTAQAAAAKRFFAGRRDAAPRLSDVAAALTNLRELSDRLERSLDDTGALTDQASPDLGRLRREVLTLSGRLRRRIESMLRSPKIAPHLQEVFFSQRDDRYVLPLKSGAQAAVKGIVHDYSASGQTVFVEPQELIESNNALRTARLEVDREERRILAELSAEVADYGEYVAANGETLIALDAIFARAALSDKLEAARPVLAPSDGPLRLPAARHPLLALRGEGVVANDILLEPPARGLIVSGPNAGGKTVSLKTVGLLALMARAGLHLPAAEGCEIPCFERVYADIGDDQDLERDLSSFSGHVRRLARILSRSGPGTLVVLDELASGTEPGEGAGLARSYLEELAERGARAFVSTHYDVLKLMAFDDERFVNASMQFDIESLEPTFRLVPGEPGRSYALEIARRFGMPGPVAERARAYVGREKIELDRVLANLEEAREEHYRLAEEAGRAKRQADEISGEAREKLDKLREKELARLLTERGALLDELLGLREDVKRARRRLNEAEDERRLAEAEKDAAALEKETSAVLKETPAPTLLPEAPRPLDWSAAREGQEVRLAGTGRRAFLAGLPDEKGRVKVEVGSIRMSVPAASVQAAPPGQKKKPAPPSAAAPAKTVHARTPPRPAPAGGEPREEARPERSLDLRGKYADEAEELVSDFLDEALRDELSRVLIIHGHGTGRLKNAVRSYLKDSPLAAAQRPGRHGEGGDGVTIVTLPGGGGGGE